MTIMVLAALLFSIPVFCADYDPAVIIRKNIRQPDAAIKELSALGTKFLRNYHDDTYNNLLHIAVQALIHQKDQSDYAATVENCKPLFRYLAFDGEVNINEANDDHMTPVFYAYGALNIDPKTRVVRPGENTSLSDFLETELGADPTCASSIWEPNVRAFKKKLKACKHKLSSVLCCKSLRCRKQ